MKKNLRLLCLGLAAATFACGFAQEDMTSKLKNPTMEPGVKGWSFIGVENVMKKGTKNAASSVGYHGISDNIFEAWRGSQVVPGTGEGTDVPEKRYYPTLSDGYAMQRLSGLEPGTYVFGAYVGATNQLDTMGVAKDTVRGVYLFANDERIPVATNNPDMKGNPRWAHTAKFNVAVTLTDADEKKGYLDVGLDIVGTDANFVLWDNATLYYFGDMSKEEALDAMAKIDIQNSLAIADTLEIGTNSPADTLVLNVDTLANFVEALKAARATDITAANLWEVNEDIYYNKGLVHKSVADYSYLKNTIENAQELVDSIHLWLVSEDTEWAEEELLPLFKTTIETANKAYEDRTMNREELTKLRKELNFLIGDVKFDSVYYVRDFLDEFIDEMINQQNVEGGYTTMQVNTMQALLNEINDTISKSESDWSEDVEERDINPNDLFPYVERVLSAIKNVKENPVTLDYTEMPIFYPRDTEGISTNSGTQTYAKGTFKNSEGLLEFASPLYRFKGKVETFRITVTATGLSQKHNGYVFFTLSGMKFFDANGGEIPLDATMVASNADHNEKNPNGLDGGGIPALFDNDGQTFFHSCWQNGPSEPHYLEVTLPNGGYDAFSFSMVSRVDGDGGTQHTFPAELTVMTPTPERDRLEGLRSRLVGLNAYTSNEVGFYAADYEAEFSKIHTLIAEVNEMLEGYPAESDCAVKAEELAEVLADFNDNVQNYSFNMPKEGKEYHIVPAVPGFQTQQHVDKALTVTFDEKGQNPKLAWETAGTDSMYQKFVFEPIMKDGEHMVEEANDVLYHLYYVKNVDSELYVDSIYANNKIKLDATRDTIKLRRLARGQWNIMTTGNTGSGGDSQVFHAGGHGGGAGKGADMMTYGGEGDLDNASAWYIREFIKFPVTVAATGEEFKSECYHFDPVNHIELTAEGVDACAFENLKLHTLLGDTIAVDTVIVKGNVATITTPNDIVECSVVFTNPGAAMVKINGYHYISKLGDLEAAYEEAVALAPTVGDTIGQCKDITAYTEAIEAAAAMLENGATDDEMEEMIKRLETVVEELEYVMPEAGKYYYIVSALAGFEERNGYKVALYARPDGNLAWAPENDVDNTFYWQFEQATKDELTAAGVADTITAFWVKNVGTENCIGAYKSGFDTNMEIPMAAKSETVPYVVTPLGSTAVALDATVVSVNNDGNKMSGRIHANGHGGGGNNHGNTTYWGAGINSSSAWNIVEVQYDVTDIDFTEVETEQAVVKGIYDLFGRRVVAPTAPGLYIIDGKKRYIK